MTSVRRSGSPLIGVSACRRQQDAHAYHVAGAKYLDAVIGGAGGVPVILPALGDGAPVEAWLDRLDGLLLTGSPSNLDPARYGQTRHDPDEPTDPARDGTTAALIRAAVARDLPLLAICRGHQELNVALGGSLHQRLADVPGLSSHHLPGHLPSEELYAPHHIVTLAPGGFLASLAGGSTATVNSVHHQGIDRIAPDLAVEAHAPDGVVEAVRLPGRRFVLGVQWHPEWRWSDSSLSRALFGAFGAACAAE